MSRRKQIKALEKRIASLEASPLQLHSIHDPLKEAEKAGFRDAQEWYEPRPYWTTRSEWSYGWGRYSSSVDPCPTRHYEKPEHFEPTWHAYLHGYEQGAKERDEREARRAAIKAKQNPINVTLNPAVDPQWIADEFKKQRGGES